MASRSRRRPASTDKRFRKNTSTAKTAASAADYGPSERWQHSGRVLVVTERAGILAARATEEHIIDLLKLRGLLTEIESAAAFRFKLDYQRAGLAAHVTGSYNPALSKTDYFRGGRERNDAEEAAYRRWRKAVGALGLILGDAVISTVCHDHKPSAASWPHLRRGLEVLAAWYGMKQEKTTKSDARSLANTQNNLL